jgi:hypothetical protein
MVIDFGFHKNRVFIKGVNGHQVPARSRTAALSYGILSPRVRSVPQVGRKMVLLQVVSPHCNHYHTPPPHFITKLVPGLPTNNYELPSRQDLPLSPDPKLRVLCLYNNGTRFLSLSISKESCREANKFKPLY